MYLSLYISLSPSLSLYIYIYICPSGGTACLKHVSSKAASNWANSGDPLDDEARIKQTRPH